ncbi:MAG: TRAP transporter substrate-binding protein DctP [Xanthobacteraceae bacterium]
MRYRSVTALAGVAVMAFAAISAAAAEPISLRVSFFASDRTDAYQSAVKPFVDAVNAEAKGLLDIHVYFSGALGKDQSKTAQSVLDGVADIAFVVTGLQPEQFYDNTIVELPGLFQGTREATLVFTRLVAAQALQGYEKFFVIGAFATEPETIHSHAPVASLKDLIGKRIGTNNKMEGAALEKLGMHPVILPVTDYAEAISGDRLDGASKSPSILFDFGIARVATYHYMLGTSVVPLTLLMNRNKFDSLPKESQDIIRKYSGEWAAARFIDVYGAAEKSAVERLTSDPKRKVITPSPADLDTAQAAFRSVRAEWAAKSPHNRELLKMVESEIAKLRAMR